MSLAENRTHDLWRLFMPRRAEINNAVSADVFSLQVYHPDHFKKFDLKRPFEKWALVEVPDLSKVPAGMSPFILEGGMYCVFSYRGLNTDSRIFQYIYTQWLPSSAFLLDERPHFEILGPKYRNNDPESEEEIWIPVRHKGNDAGIRA